VYIIVATASMNSLKNIAGAFATPPVPPGIVPIPTDDDPYTPNLPVPPSHTTLSSNSGNSPRMTIEHMALLFERLPRLQNAQTTRSASKLYHTNPTAAVK
jgi:hypothetical protein